MRQNCFLTFIVADAAAVKAVLGACPYFHKDSLTGVRKPFDQMLKAMHQPDQDATTFARLFVGKCGENVRLNDRGGTSSCIFQTPSGQFSIIGNTNPQGWLMILGNWESPATIRGYLEPLKTICKPMELMVNFPEADKHQLVPITLHEALQRLATM